MKRYVITLIVDDNSGLLARVSSLMCRKGFNIHSIAASTTFEKGTTRITVVADGSRANIDQLVTQTKKLQEVKKILVHDDEKSLYRELLIIKISFDSEAISNLRDYAKIYGAKIIDLKFNSMIFELTGHSKKIDAFIEIMSNYEIVEMCRSGITAIERGGKPSLD